MLQLRANQGYLTWFTNKLGTIALFFPFFSLGHGGPYIKTNHEQVTNTVILK